MTPENERSETCVTFDLGTKEVTPDQIRLLRLVLEKQLTMLKNGHHHSEIILDDQVLYGPVRESVLDLYATLCRNDPASLPAQLAMAWQLHRLVVESESNVLKTGLVDAHQVISQQLEIFQQTQVEIRESLVSFGQEHQIRKKEVEFIEKQLLELSLKGQIQAVKLENLMRFIDQVSFDFREFQRKVWKLLWIFFLMCSAIIISGLVFMVWH